ALSVQSAAFQATLVIGPAAAGLLIAHAGFALVYWLNVICFGAAFITVARLPALRPEGGGERAGLASLIGGIRDLKSSGPLAGAFLIDLGAMVFGMPRALFPAMAVTVYHGGATTVGYLNAAPGLGALIGSLLTGHVAGSGGSAGPWRSASWAGAWRSPASGWCAGFPPRCCCWSWPARPTWCHRCSG